MTMHPLTFAIVVGGIAGAAWLALEAYSRGWHDVALYRVRCLGIFHRPAQRAFGDATICTRCGTTMQAAR